MIGTKTTTAMKELSGELIDNYQNELNKAFLRSDDGLKVSLAPGSNDHGLYEPTARDEQRSGTHGHHGEAESRMDLRGEPGSDALAWGKSLHRRPRGQAGQ